MFLLKLTVSVLHSDLLKSGFVPNEGKSLWEPVQIITWLGMIFNTIDGTVKANNERIEKLNAGLVELSSYPPPCKVHVINVTSVTGQIISLSSCVGSVARIMTRFLFSVMNSARSWDNDVFLSGDSHSEINFWKNNVVSLKWKGLLVASVLPGQGHVLRCFQFGLWCFP